MSDEFKGKLVKEYDINITLSRRLQKLMNFKPSTLLSSSQNSPYNKVPLLKTKNFT